MKFIRKWNNIDKKKTIHRYSNQHQSFIRHSRFVSVCDSPLVNDGSTNLTAGQSIPYGTVISIECDIDFELNGPSIVTCEADGSWSFNTTCESACKKLTYVYITNASSEEICVEFGRFPTFKFSSSTNNRWMSDRLDIDFDEFGNWLLGYMIDFSYLYFPQGHYCISTLWRWRSDEYVLAKIHL